MFWMTKKKRQKAEEDRAKDQEQFLRRLNEAIEVRPGLHSPPMAGAMASLLVPRRGLLGTGAPPCALPDSFDPAAATLLCQARARAQGFWILAGLMSGRIEDILAQQRLSEPEETLAGCLVRQ